ncbi:MAG: NUDIX domain-containing protein [Ruminococcus sp.]|nr:NUDIX domain-containing protein [Ruminococcus sp.]
MTFRYCPECGCTLVQRETAGKSVPYCESCQQFCFPVSLPCVICLVVNEYNEIALIKQTYATKNKVCIAGFIEQGETAEQAALREVKEETGLTPLSVRYISSYYYEKKDNLMLGFAAFVNKAEFHIQPDEVESAAWYSIDEARHELSKGVTGKDLLRDWLRE